MGFPLPRDTHIVPEGHATQGHSQESEGPGQNGRLIWTIEKRRRQQLLGTVTKRPSVLQSGGGWEIPSCEYGPPAECQVVEGDGKMVMSQRTPDDIVGRSQVITCIVVTCVHFSYHISYQHTEFNLMSQWKEAKYYPDMNKGLLLKLL